MGRDKTKETSKPVSPLSPQQPVVGLWLKAVYHFHVFHYRMPETVAIAAVTPFVPSPLTVKMAMVAALLQRGEGDEARALARYLPEITVRIVPPRAAFSFKAFLRYRSVPAVESAGGLDETGSYYQSRPHTREYALLSDELVLYVGLRDRAIRHDVEKALRNIRYLGCKDSLVWCKSLNEVDTKEAETALIVEPLCERHLKGKAGPVVLLADFRPDVKDLKLKRIIPGSRQDRDYQHPPLPHVLPHVLPGHINVLPHVLPGRIIVKGRTRLFLREDLLKKLST